jgi:hypothetical protein
MSSAASRSSPRKPTKDGGYEERSSSPDELLKKGKKRRAAVIDVEESDIAVSEPASKRIGQSAAKKSKGGPKLQRSRRAPGQHDRSEAEVDQWAHALALYFKAGLCNDKWLGAPLYSPAKAAPLTVNSDPLRLLAALRPAAGRVYEQQQLYRVTHRWAADRAVREQICRPVSRSAHLPNNH